MLWERDTRTAWQREQDARADAIQERQRKTWRDELKRYGIDPAAMTDKELCLALGLIACRIGETLRATLDKIGVSDARACERASFILGHRVIALGSLRRCEVGMVLRAYEKAA